MKGFWIVLCVLCVISFIVFGIARVNKYYDFEINCGGHLKRAADANTVEMAIPELQMALKYIEENHLTEGSSHFLFKTPECDLAFWHNNLQASLKELQSIDPKASLLERTNVLMKLRQTLLDHTEKGESVTTPPHISVYPNQWPYEIWCWVSAVGMCLFGFFAAVVDDSPRYGSHYR